MNLMTRYTSAEHPNFWKPDMPIVEDEQAGNLMNEVCCQSEINLGALL